MIKFSFTEAWLQPRAAAAQASSPQSRPVQGKRPWKTQAWALLSSQCLPRPPPLGRSGLSKHFYLLRLLSFQESGCTLTHLVPLEIRCVSRVHVCMCLWVQGVCSFLPHMPSVPSRTPAVFTPLPSTPLTSSSPWRGSFSQVRGMGSYATVHLR